MPTLSLFKNLCTQAKKISDGVNAILSGIGTKVQNLNNKFCHRAEEQSPSSTNQRVVRQNTIPSPREEAIFIRDQALERRNQICETMNQICFFLNTNHCENGQCAIVYGNCWCSSTVQVLHYLEDELLDVNNAIRTLNFYLVHHSKIGREENKPISH